MANFFKKYGSSLAGGLVGGLTSGMPNAGKYSAALATGAGALTAAAQKQNAGKGALYGFGGGLLGAMGAQGLKGAVNAQGSSPMNAFSSGSGTGWRGYMGSIPGMGGFGTSTPTGALAKMTTMRTPQMTGQTRSAMTPFEQANAAQNQQVGVQNALWGNTQAGTYGNAAPIVPGTATKMTSPAGTIAQVQQPGITTSKIVQPAAEKNIFKQVLPGLGVSMMGDLFAKDVAAPDFSQQISRLNQAATEGANPEARALGMGQLRSILSTPAGGSAESGLANTRLISDRQRADALKANEQAFRAAMPGADYTQSSDYQKAVREINSLYDQNYQAQAAQVQYQYDQALRQEKLMAMQTALGLDETQMNYLSQVAGLEIDQIMAQTGLEYGEAAQLKELFGTVGTAMVEGSLGLTRLPNMMAV